MFEFILALPFTGPSFLMVLLWQSRPIVSLILAGFLAFVVMAAPGIFLTFQAMEIYGAGDPQLMAGGISAALTGSTRAMFVILPLLILFQWICRSDSRKKKEEMDGVDQFE